MANCIIDPKILAAAATILVERRQGVLQRMLQRHKFNRIQFKSKTKILTTQVG